MERVDNETEDYDAGNNVEVRAWRRLPEYPEWSIYVRFGDSGWESDPAIFGENKTKTLELIEDEIRQLNKAADWIRENL